MIKSSTVREPLAPAPWISRCVLIGAFAIIHGGGVGS